MIIDIPSIIDICEPIHCAKPVELKPPAKAIPPPKSKMIPQGIFTASSQLIIRSSFLEEGIMNSTTPAIMAIMVSSSAGMNFCSINERVIQQKAVAANTISTRFSSLLSLPSSFSRRDISCFPPGNSVALSLKAYLVRYFQQIKRSTTDIGKPNLNH